MARHHLTWHSTTVIISHSPRFLELQLQVRLMAERPTECALAAFDVVDIDRSGELELAELVELLCNWGLPEADAAHAMRRAGVVVGGTVKREDWTSTHGLEMVWRFIFADLCEFSRVERLNGEQRKPSFAVSRLISSVAPATTPPRSPSRANKRAATSPRGESHAGAAPGEVGRFGTNC